MMAGVRNLTSGECTLLATGVIAAHEGGPAGEAAMIGATTTRVIFKLTALTAEIKAAPGSAFNITPAANYGTTIIGDTQHPVFKIEAATTAGTAETTTAELALLGWGNGAEENDTNQFIYLVHDKTQTFGLAGIGMNTQEGDAPLPSTANITWSITNDAGLLGYDPIEITFTSKSTAADASGMGWLPVRVAVQAFSNTAGGQVWQVGSGILRNQLDAGAGTAGAGIVILHGNKMYSPGVGTEQDWLWEYVLDLANPAPAGVPGMWTYTAPQPGVPSDAGFYTLLRHNKAKTQVRVINSTTTDRIVVTDNAVVTVVLDGMSIDLASGSANGSPFEMKTGSKVTLYLKGSNTLKGWLSLGNQAAGLQAGDGIGELRIKSGGTGGALTAIPGTVGAGIGGATIYQPCGKIIIEGGDITATGYSGQIPNWIFGMGAGIGGAYGSVGGDITITGGTISATGGDYGAGIGNSEGWDLDPNIREGGNITITGGMITATGGKGGAGIGSGRYATCSNILITGGTITATGNVAAGIGNGKSNPSWTNGNITITGGTITATGGSESAGIGGGLTGVGSNLRITGGTIFARGYGGAGIGGGWDSGGGTIIIEGGDIYAYSSSGGGGGAGIGGGELKNNNYNVDGGNITITGGTVKAMGGTGAGIGGGGGIGIGGAVGAFKMTGGMVIAQSTRGAGIGGGFGTDANGSGGAGVDGGNKIEIEGGTVIAIGGSAYSHGSAGIGGGGGKDIAGGAGAASGSSINISGGVVFAQGGASSGAGGAGIGAGAGGAFGGDSGDIIITGGTVYAKEGYSAASIGLSAKSGGAVGTISAVTPVIFADSVSGGSIAHDAANGIFIGTGNVAIVRPTGGAYNNFAGSFPSYAENMVVTATLKGGGGLTPIIPATATLTVPKTGFNSFTVILQAGDGITLTNNGKIVNEGAIAINAGNALANTTGIVINNGTVTKSGGLVNPQGNWTGTGPQ
jgi:hypothetical protein